MRTQKILYIIPGYKETTSRKSYKKLKNIAEAKGYKVVMKNIDWKRNLSIQIFKIEENSILFGFSMGAIMAKLIAQENNCKKLILASMTPLKYFNEKKNIKLLSDICGKSFVYDIKNILKTENLARQEIIIYGDLEKEEGEIIVKNTGHNIEVNYLNAIKKIL